MNNKKLFLILGTTLSIIVIFAVAAYFYKSAETARVNEISSSKAELLIRFHSPQTGAENAKVTVVEFLDPQCETCRAFSPLVKQFMKQHEGKIRLVIRYAAFHDHSKDAIKVLEAARKQGKYWETLEIVFKNLPEWGDHVSPKPELLWTYLAQVGVDEKQARIDAEDPAIDTLIEIDSADGMQLGANKTPSFFINGKPLEEFGYQQLVNAIEAEL